MFYRVDTHAFHLHSVEIIREAMTTSSSSMVGPVNFYVAFFSAVSA